MKNLKKVVSVIVTVAMLISSFAALSVSAAEYGDVTESNSHYKAIKVLSGLGIVKGDDEGNFNPTSDIKRSEMVALICREMGQEAAALASGGSTFDDVAANHWAAGYISWGVASNIINGVGDNKFDPDASVKFQDAVVMILRALGYERIALRPENGGYPTGYMKVASQRGVLANASNFDGGKAATREIVAQVIYNSLTTPLVDVSYYADKAEDDEYFVYDGKNGKELRTVLTYTNNIYKVKATVENTAKSLETLRKDVDNHKVELDIVGTYEEAPADILNGDYADANGDLKSPATIKPFVGDTDVSDFIGYTVEAYIVEDEDLNDWKLLAAVVDTKSVTSETVNPVDSDFVSFNGSVFEYTANPETDTRTTKIDVKSADLKIYYNGVLAYDPSAATPVDYITAQNGWTDVEDLLINEADVITFMGDKNDDYDKIFVTDYIYKQVEAVNADTLYIDFEEPGYVELDAEARNDKTFIYNLYNAEGETIDFADIQEKDILNIVAPLDSGVMDTDLDTVKCMDIYVTNETVTGSVDEDFGNGTYTIAGNKYKLEANASPLQSGEEGIFYLTVNGLVYASDAASVVTKNYAFIVAVDNTDTSFGTTVYKIKLFTADGKMETYNIASTLKVYADNAGTYRDTTYYRDTAKSPNQSGFHTTVSGYVAADTETNANNNLAKRVIVYSTNEDGEIREIRFAGIAGQKFEAMNVNGRYSEDTQVFAYEDIDNNTKLFVAPLKGTTNASDWVVDPDDLKIASFSSMDEDKDYTGKAFMFDNDDYLGAVVINKNISAPMKKTHLAVVKAISTGLAADRITTVTKYTFVQSGKTITLAVDDEKYAEVKAAAGNADMAIGDVFRYTVDADGEIDAIEFIYDASTVTFDEGNYPYEELRDNDVALVYGKITEIKSNKMTIAATFDDDDNAGTPEVALPKLTLNDTEGNTYASVQENNLTASSAVKVLTSAAGLKESYGTQDYYVVAIVGENNRFEDCVMIIK